MTSRKVLESLSKGAVLCMGHHSGKKMYWMEPGGGLVQKDIAEQIIKLPGMKNGKDGLFKDAFQTWSL